MSTIARWLSTDPMGLILPLEPYLYAGNAPLRFIDPSGLNCEDTDEEVVKFAMGKIVETDIASIYGGGCKGYGASYLIVVDFSAEVNGRCNDGAQWQIYRHATGVLNYLFSITAPCEHVSTSFYNVAGFLQSDWSDPANCIGAEFTFFCPVKCEDRPLLSCSVTPKPGPRRRKCVPHPSAGTLRIGTTPRLASNADTVVS